MPLRSEKECRRPGWSEGYSVILADGQSWTFPKPRLRLFPVRDKETGKITMGGGPTWGDEYAEMLDELVQCEETAVFERIELQLRMAAHLLFLNYDLADEDLSTLLVLEADDPASKERWDAINPILLGQAPKPSADGSATPSSPTA